MDDERPRHSGEHSSVCPFLHRDEGASSHVCLWKTRDPIIISPGYVDVYCRVSKHQECSLFLRAERTSRPNDQGDGQVAQAPESRAPDGRSARAVGQLADDDLPRTRRRNGVGLDGDWASLLEVENVRRDRVAAPPAPTITDPKTWSSHPARSVKFAGTAGSQLTVKLFDWGSFVAETDADRAGRWSMTLSPLEHGDHAYYAIAIDAAGHASAQSAVLTISVTSATSNAASGPALPAASEFGARLTSKLRGLFGRSRRPTGLPFERETRGEPTPAAVDAEDASELVSLKGQYGTAPHAQSPPSLAGVERTRPTRSTSDAEGRERLTFGVGPMMQSGEEPLQHRILPLIPLKGDGQSTDTWSNQAFMERVALPDATTALPVIPADRMMDEPLRPTSARVEIPQKAVRPEAVHPTKVMPTSAASCTDAPPSSVTAAPLRGNEQYTNSRTDKGFIDGLARSESTRGVPAMPAEVMLTSAAACVDMSPSSIAAAPTPLSVATPIEVDAEAAPIDETVTIPSLEVEAVLAGNQKKLPGAEMDEIDLKTHLTDPVPIAATVDRQLQEPAAGMRDEDAGDTAPGALTESIAPCSQTPVRPTPHDPTPALRQATPAPLRSPRQGRRWYMLPSAAAVVIALLAGTYLLRPHSTSQPTVHLAPHPARHLIPVPTTVWSFPPLQASVDQLVFTFSNPGNAAVRVRITAPGAGNKVVWSAHISARNGAEITLDPHVYHGTLVVQASGPVVAARTTVHHGTVQYSYGIPGGRNGQP